MLGPIGKDTVSPEGTKEMMFFRPSGTLLLFIGVPSAKALGCLLSSLRDSMATCPDVIKSHLSFPEIRHKHHRANHRRANRRQEHPAGGDVLGPTDAQAVFLGDFVGKNFDGGVEGFGHPDEGDGDGQPEPVGAGDFQGEAEGEDDDGGSGMNPGIVLRDGEVAESAEGVAETVEALGEGERHN